MIAAGNSCRALKAASFSRVTETWRLVMQVAGYLLAAAGLLGLVVLPPSAVAQARAGVPRIGILFFGAAPVGAGPELVSSASISVCPPVWRGLRGGPWAPADWPPLSVLLPQRPCASGRCTRSPRRAAVWRKSARALGLPLLCEACGCARTR